MFSGKGGIVETTCCSSAALVGSRLNGSAFSEVCDRKSFGLDPEPSPMLTSEPPKSPRGVVPDELMDNPVFCDSSGLFCDKPVKSFARVSLHFDPAKSLALGSVEAAERPVLQGFAS